MKPLLGLLLACAFGLAQAGEIDRNDLPPEAQETLVLIAQGGPFPYRRDGIEFRKFEKLLPLKERGHYREYTVNTPGVKHRGARRIVCGGNPPTRPAACYYTADHYQSFSKIQP
jgi:ribonuclease T1